MAMLPNLRIDAPPASPGTPGAEDAPAPDLFAQLLALLPNGAPAATPVGETVTSTLGLAAEPAEGDREAGPDDPEAAIMFLPTFEMQRAAAPLAAAAPAAQPVAGNANAPAPAASAPAPAAAPEPAPSATAPAPSATATVPSTTAPAPAPQTPVPGVAPAAAGKIPGEAPARTPVRAAQAPVGAPAAPGAEVTQARREVPVPEPLRRVIQALKAAAPASAPATAAAVEAARQEKVSSKAVAPVSAAAAPQPVQQPVLHQVQQPLLAIAEPPPQPAAEPLAMLPRESVAEAVERQLDVTGDAEWLDQLARDIARTGAAGGEGGALRFRLNPETLGQLRVEVSQGADGATVRIAAETEGARVLLADAQSRLLAEARAQGVRIAETEVSLAGSGSDDPQRREEAQAEPWPRTPRTSRGGTHEGGEEPTRTTSDRYA